MQNREEGEELHKSVLKNEVNELLGKDKYAPLNIQARIIDATVGLGGHSKDFACSGWQILGIDTDRESIAVAEKVLRKACPTHLQKKVGTFKLVHGNFKDIGKIAKEYEFTHVEAILFDLGVSVPQLTSKTRGFSFQNADAALDMRLGKTTQNVTAADLLNVLSGKQLVEIFNTVMSLNASRRMSKKILDQRKVANFKKVGDFLDLVGSGGGKRKLHPATLPFMALRIAVNSELDILQETLPEALELLAEKGRLAVISFHSGEDRVVKQLFRKWESEGSGKIITKKPILPTKNEITSNPRSRSAKLRVIEKT
jgi:16S rRNA (cytosine1402-N4)-methyltransferase